LNCQSIARTDDQTGTCYSMPQVRHRPIYPLIRDDGKRDGNVRKGGCDKLYANYGKKNLTGGLMVVWCTHSIAYGFHCIPSAEGRNDVFSAMMTRWQKAPKLVVYDFACSLGPYCLTREPKFWDETRFVIDHFHAQGHVSCSEACFMRTYTDVNPGLQRINTSAAECGNSILGRIRKAVSYMSQRRAIVFARVFLGLTNRVRIKNLAERGWAKRSS
jgi:hypothetical protein